MGKTSILQLEDLDTPYYMAPDGTLWRTKAEYYEALDQMSCSDIIEGTFQVVEEETVVDYDSGASKRIR